ncbi:hypothetical protein [Massilia sp. CCM 8734]|uniref:hypothetical protein n=1 Tax=Massilia sp. CCM 8734 TaxID=2609283 RepID=UPI001423E270|nr:hypothetical protein [Massilia sp. CCM 8734]NHZ95914.1 hypothetical protein [Massilia sp. CCM 8734]
MHNPYHPPPSAAPDVPADLPGRPLSVWLFLLIMWPTTLALAIGAIRFSWFTLGAINVAWFSSPFPASTSYRLLGGIAWRLAVLALLFTTVLGATRRRQWGRWLGILLLGAMTVGVFFLPETIRHAGDAGSPQALPIPVSLMATLAAWWTYAFGFSRKARRYYRT